MTTFNDSESPVEEPLLEGEEAVPAAETTSSEVEPEPSVEEELARWKDLALRSRADLENYRKRIAVEKADAIRYANQSLFESLLPVFDNFHFGLDAARAATDPQGVLMGMEMVLKQFEDFLASQNITEVAVPAGSPFDPNLHEAMAQEYDAAVAEGCVIKVLRKGYRMGDRLVRAANVIVSKGPQQVATEGETA